MERVKLTYQEYWGYFWRVIGRHRILGIFQWDEQLVDFIIDRCGIQPGTKILDLGCGGGDQARVFARKGYLITGVDYVPSLIKYATDSFENEGLQGDFILQDMRDIEYENQFDLVMMLSGTFGIFSDSQNRGLLHKAHRALKPAGKAFLDYLPVEKHAQAGRSRTWHPIENGYALAEEWFDTPTSTYRTRHMHILTDGRIIEGADEEGYGANEVIRCYEAEEIEALARDCGFAVVAHLAKRQVTNPGETPEAGEPRGMLVVEKPVR